MGILSWFKKQMPSRSKHSRKINLKKVKLNLQKDLQDDRDYIFNDHPELFTSVAGSVSLPEYVSLIHYASPIKNQGTLGACSGFASTAAFEILYLMNNPEEVLDTSELFTYYQARAKEGTISKDVGAYLRDICDSVLKDGICLEVFCPYNIKQFAQKPSTFAYFVAKKFKITGYYRCNNLIDIKTAIANNLPVIIGMQVYENFMDNRGQIYNTTSGQLFGGHAMCVVGYDDKRNAVLVKNSWGTSWGTLGYGWINYDVLMNNLFDAWVIKYDPPNMISKLINKTIV